MIIALCPSRCGGCLYLCQYVSLPKISECMYVHMHACIRAGCTCKCAPYCMSHDVRQSRVEIGGDPGYRNGSGGQRGITPGTGNDATGLGNIIIIIIPCLGRV